MTLSLKQGLFGNKYGTTLNNSLPRIFSTLNEHHIYILNVLLDGERYSYSFSKLQKKLDIPKSTLSRLLATLICNKLIQKKTINGLGKSSIFNVNPIYVSKIRELLKILVPATDSRYCVICLHKHYTYSYPELNLYKIYYKVAKYATRIKKRKFKNILRLAIPGTAHSLLVYPHSGMVKIYLEFPLLIEYKNRQKLEQIIEAAREQELNFVLEWIKSQYNGFDNPQLNNPFSFDDYIEISFLRNKIAYYLFVKGAVKEFKHYLDKSKKHPEIEFKGELYKTIEKAKCFLYFLEIVDKFGFNESDAVEFACYLANKLASSLENKRRGGV